MSADGIVRGHMERTDPWRNGEAARVVLRDKPDHLTSVPVQLIPNDGTRVVVTVEEWGRMRNALEACETVIPWLAGQLEFAVRGVSVRDMTESLEMARTVVERARSILGTNGDTHED